MLYKNLSPHEVDEIVQLALSDKVQFSAIASQFSIQEKEIKIIMRKTLKSGSYKAWRKRVRQFSDRRKHYK